MQVHLRYFALVREVLGRSEETRDVPSGTTAGELFERVLAEAPQLAGLKRSVMLMVNQEYVPAGHQLSDGDELAIIPPVSGGADEAERFWVTEEPLDARAIEALVADPGSGAIVTFTGTVRNVARGKEVIALDYEAYPPAAEKMLRRIGDEMRERWDVKQVAIVHRIGSLQVGEASVVISVSAPHREEAFAACRYAIERIKEIVPIWKKEQYADGAVWIGSEAAYQREIGRAPAEVAVES
ncbi:MAG TPA: molybdopterin converting factor subunit 1 [Thermomicrobiales bacterium]|jgi:molybdopterin converting factor subunit 1